MIISYDPERHYNDFEPEFDMKEVPRDVRLRFFIAYLVRRNPGKYTKWDIIHQLDARYGSNKVSIKKRINDFEKLFEEALGDGYIGCRVDPISGGEMYYSAVQVEGWRVRKKRRK